MNFTSFTEYSNIIVLEYERLMNLGDKRSDGLFLMESPFPSFAICFAYFIFVYFGKILMKDREPFEMRSIMMVYNFAMVALSAYILYEFNMSGWATGYTLGCETVDYSNSPKAIRMLHACNLFHISKYIELADTLFFLLRKKFSHLSFLHVFHHGIMPCSWWFGVKFVPGGLGTFHGMLNSFIHMVMYAYYALAACGPALQPYLFWKKYMTSMQIMQFVIVVIHSCQLLVTDCAYPRIFVYWILSYAVIFLVLFANFWRQSYTGAKPGAAVPLDSQGRPLRVANDFGWFRSASPPRYVKRQAVFTPAKGRMRNGVVNNDHRGFTSPPSEANGAEANGVETTQRKK